MVCARQIEAYDSLIYNYNKLWKILIDKNLTKTELRIKAGLSTNVLANMNKGKPVSLEALAKICLVLDCNLDDLIELYVKRK